MKQITFLLLILTLVLSACGASPEEPVNSETPNTPNQTDYAPRPEDAALVRSEAYPSSTDLLTMESYPLQFMLSLTGELPTPCHQLRVLVNPPDAENKIFVEVYSVTSPDQVCIQVLSPFEVNVPLGSFPSGHYILLINGEQTAEFDA